MVKGLNYCCLYHYSSESFVSCGGDLVAQPLDRSYFVWSPEIPDVTHTTHTALWWSLGEAEILHLDGHCWLLPPLYFSDSPGLWGLIAHLTVLEMSVYFSVNLQRAGNYRFHCWIFLTQCLPYNRCVIKVFEMKQNEFMNPISSAIRSSLQASFTSFLCWPGHRSSIFLQCL